MVIAWAVALPCAYVVLGWLCAWPTWWWKGWPGVQVEEGQAAEWSLRLPEGTR
jgi:hypothetical protein